MTNIPAGYNDEGGRGLSQDQVGSIECNWDKIQAHLDKAEPVKKCYQCSRPLRVLNIIGGRYVCEDCIAELNLK